MTRPLTTILFGALTILGGCDIRSGEASSESRQIGDVSNAAPAGPAQSGDFEGVISTNVYVDGERIEQTLSIKGSRWRFDMEVDGDRAAIIRGGDGRVFSLLHDSRQFVYFPVVPDSPSDAGLRFEATGERASVAGYSCQYYVMRDPSGTQDGDRMCVTAEFGFVGVMSASPLAAADERAIREQFREGFLILAVLSPQGQRLYEVTGIQRTSLSDTLFEPPEGYQRLG